MSWIRRLGCSHAVIGPITINSELDIHLDDQYLKYNWKVAGRMTRGLKSRSGTVKTLLYLDFALGNFTSTEDLDFAKLEKKLSAVFNFNGFVLKIPEEDFVDDFLNFVKKLKSFFVGFQIDVEITSMTSMKSLFGMEEVFDNFYVNVDKEIPFRNSSIFDEYRLVDPLFPNSEILSNETISGLVNKVASLIEPHRLIVGLSSLARGIIANNETNFDRGQDWLLEKNMTLKQYESTDGRFSLQEICEPLILVPIKEDESTMTNYFLDRNQNWFSLNAPYSTVTYSKLRWIIGEGVAGIGISDLTADDPNSDCRYGKFPLLRFLSSNFDCKFTARSQVKRSVCGKFLPIL
ncbi:unnamed protein product [Bursaphelenchus xylophilus]|uniref:(pine wood nematode) hypothetical protein n=1 Tax=Bursaphelenchus xylophilus TaxID=6326 RepID=A0A1I7S677_BURXY|nr:unnamed protein product [Bursaphelenchus xylophilus]CAG9081087.1 unnamed protein product [Bursaphelenchus xylophilus]